MLRSTDKWYGVTYREDKPQVVAAIAAMTQSGSTRKGCGISETQKNIRLIRLLSTGPA